MESIFRKHYSFLYEKLVSLPDVLDSMIMKFYEKEYISLNTKSILMNNPDISKKADLLLTHCKMNIDQDQKHHFLLVCSILNEEPKFKKLVEKMRSEANAAAQDTNHTTVEGTLSDHMLHAVRYAYMNIP